MPQLVFSVRRMMIAVAIIAVLFGGLVFAFREFGFQGTLGLSLLLALPLLVVARLGLRSPELRARELVYLGILISVLFGAVVSVVRNWYATGMDRVHAEDVKWSAFGRLIRKDPAFRDVRINRMDGKNVYWPQGTVATEADLDRLRSLASRCGIDLGNAEDLRVFSK